MLLSNSESDEDEGVGDFEKERMNIVRMLQRSYYRDVPDDGSDQTMESLPSSAAASLDPATGRINNLPLWRVGWVETPGRRNCLNVHEMQYTHMFEKILSQSSSGADGQENDEPLYFGHIYLPGGTASAKSGEERYRLKTWREELVDENRFDNYGSSSTLNAPGIRTPTVDRSAVLGCLMQIIDHRRMEDGRLMILVQALERFVVEEIVDTRPFSVANVQVLLDKEELPWYGNDSREGVMSSGRMNADENFCKNIRGKAVAASFYYHDYEFDHPSLPYGNINECNDTYIATDDVDWIQISKLLPFSHYSTDEVCLDAANEKTGNLYDSIADLNDSDDGSSFADGELPLEQELWAGGIMWDPPPVPNVIIRRSQDNLDCDTLETLLWLALEDFCRATGFTLPEEVKCLLPPEMDYLDIKPDRYLSINYPKIRRQRRLSYLAPALIENLEIPMKGMRQVWLNTPSTTARLLGALERYEYLNNKMMGQFE